MIELKVFNVINSNNEVIKVIKAINKEVAYNKLKMFFGKNICFVKMIEVDTIKYDVQKEMLKYE